MKLVVAIVQDKDSHSLRKAFVNENIRATKLASTGGFLSEGNTTYLIGVEDEQVDHVLEIIRRECHSREQMLPSTPSQSISGIYPIKVTVGGATVFVLDVEHFDHF